MPVLLILMTIKFFMIVSLFMHLKYDNKLFGCDVLHRPRASPSFVYFAALLTFRFFDVN